VTPNRSASPGLRGLVDRPDRRPSVGAQTPPEPLCLGRRLPGQGSHQPVRGLTLQVLGDDSVETGSGGNIPVS